MRPRLQWLAILLAKHATGDICPRSALRDAYCDQVPDAGSKPGYPRQPKVDIFERARGTSRYVGFDELARGLRDARWIDKPKPTTTRGRITSRMLKQDLYDLEQLGVIERSREDDLVHIQDWQALLDVIESE